MACHEYRLEVGIVTPVASLGRTRTKKSAIIESCPSRANQHFSCPGKKLDKIIAFEVTGVILKCQYSILEFCFVM